MATFATTRLGVTRWTSNQDTLTRAQMDNSHRALEGKGVRYEQGTSRPTASAAYEGAFYWHTSNQVLDYCNGTTWEEVRSIDGSAYGSPSALVVGQVPEDGTSDLGARSDHVHGLFGFGASATSVGTSLSEGVASTISRSDHAHDIAVGGIDSSTLFAAGVVDSAAIGSQEVGTSELEDDSVTSDKFGPGAVDTTALGDDEVTSSKFATGAVDSTAIGAGEVGTSEIDSSITAGGTPSFLGFASSDPGSNDVWAKSDHTHSATTTSPIGLDKDFSEGVFSSKARSDHVHSSLRYNEYSSYSTNFLSYDTVTGYSGAELIGTPQRIGFCFFDKGWTNVRLLAWASVRAEVYAEPDQTMQVNSRLSIEGLSNGPNAQSGAMLYSEDNRRIGYSTPVFEVVGDIPSGTFLWLEAYKYLNGDGRALHYSISYIAIQL